MANQILGYEIYSDLSSVVYSGGAWQVPLSAMASPYVKERAISSSTDEADTCFYVDLGAARDLKVWCLTHTNLSSSALYRLTGYSDAFTTQAWQTGWLAPSVPEIDPDNIGAAIWHVFASVTSLRWARCEIKDPTNPDGFVAIGRNIMPRSLGVARNPDVSATDEMVPNTPRQNSGGGTRFTIRRTPARKYGFAYSGLNPTDEPAAVAEIRRLRRYCNLDRQVVIIPDPDDVANFAERNFVGTLDASPALALLAGDATNATGFAVLEVV